MQIEKGRDERLRETRGFRGRQRHRESRGTVVMGRERASQEMNRPRFFGGDDNAPREMNRAGGMEIFGVFRKF